MHVAHVMQTDLLKISMQSFTRSILDRSSHAGSNLNLFLRIKPILDEVRRRAAPHTSYYPEHTDQVESRNF